MVHIKTFWANFFIYSQPACSPLIWRTVHMKVYAVPEEAGCAMTICPLSSGLIKSSNEVGGLIAVCLEFVANPSEPT